MQCHIAKKFQCHPQSPLFTLLPPCIRMKTDPRKPNETYVCLILFLCISTTEHFFPPPITSH